MAFELTEAREDEITQVYPRPVAEAFKKALEAQGVAAHPALLGAAECSMKYLALVAWSEYAHQGVRASKTDAWVGTVKRPAMGQWLRLFRETSPLNATSVLSVNLAQRHAVADVERQAHFRLVWNLVKEGIGFEIPPSRLGGYVDRQLAAGQPGKLTVLEYLDAVVDCRNWFHHQAEKGYRFGPEIGAILNPLLRESLGELLFMEPIRRLMVEYPWACPTAAALPFWDASIGLFKTEFKLQRARGGYRKFAVTSPKPLVAGSGYLVRGSDKTPYVQFDWGWPDPSIRPEAQAASAPASAPDPDDRQARALVRYETRYRDYLLDDGVLSATEREALEDLADLGGLDADAVEKIRARVDQEDAVIARLAVDAVVAQHPVDGPVQVPTAAETETTPEPETTLPASEPPPGGAKPLAWIVRERRVEVRSWADIARWTAGHLAEEHPAAWVAAMDGPEFQGRLVRRVGRVPEGMLKPRPIGDGYIELNLSARECLAMARQLLALTGIEASECHYVLHPRPPEADFEAAPPDWPGSALRLLTRLHAELDGTVPCAVTGVTDIDDIEVENNGNGLQLSVDAKRYIEVWFASKYGPTVWVVVSFASRNSSRDPVFRATRAAMMEHEDLEQVPGWPFEEADGRLSFEAMKRLSVEDLGSDAVVEHVAGLVRLLAGWVARHHPNAGLAE